MAGLLDRMWADPSGQALTALGGGLLGVRSGNEGAAIQNALRTFQLAQESQRRNQLAELQRRQAEMQLKGLEQQQKDNDVLRGIYGNPANFMRSPQAAFPPNEMDPEGSPAALPAFDQALLAQNLLKSGTLAGAKEGIGMMAKDDKETVVAPGATVLKNGRPIFTAPSADQKGTPLAQLLQEQSKYPPGSPIWKFYQDRIAKENSHPPAANVAVNTGDKSFLKGLGEGASKRVDAAMIAADSAQQSIYKLGELKDALGKEIIAGPAADFRILWTRVGRMIGAGGRDDAEVLANTASVVQQLAAQELQAAQGMRGQGQITENERKLIKKAAAGDINMTVDEIKTLVATLDKQARFTIQWANKFTAPLRDTLKGSPMESFYSIQEPPQGARFLGFEGK
jgi:hypothetical protein